MHPFFKDYNFFGFVHRGGDEEKTENTLEAFQYSSDLGFVFIETDVQSTLDGEIVIFHDNDLRRVAGLDVKISDLTYKEIQGIELINGGKVPTLNETLIAARLPNGKVPRTNCWLQHYAFPELKSYSIDDLDNLRLRIESEGDVDSLLRESPMYRNADIQIKPHITLSGFKTSVLNSRVKIQNISAFGIHAITPTFTGLIVTGCNGREENKKG